MPAPVPSTASGASVAPTRAWSARARKPRRPASRAGVTVYVGGVLTLSVVGGVAIRTDSAGAAGIGGLLFITSPAVMAVGMRWLGREGWGDAGLRLGTRRGWYAAGLAVPAALGAALAVGFVMGASSVPEGGAARFATLFAAGLVGRLVFSFFEELGWRGYLEPRLAAIGVEGLRRHLLVGAVWGVWHVPYVVALGSEYTSLPLAVHLPLFLLAVQAMGVVWGVLRERTGSVWPAVLGHGLANALAFPLLDAGVVRIANDVVFSPRPEGLVALACLAATAAVVWRAGRA